MRCQPSDRQILRPASPQWPGSWHRRPSRTAEARALHKPGPSRRKQRATREATSERSVPCSHGDECWLAQSLGDAASRNVLARPDSLGKQTDCSLGLFRLESPWPLFSCVGDLAVPIDNENALRPACIQVIHGIVDRVHDARNGEAQFFATGLSDRPALVPFLGLIKNHLVSFVRLHLPAVSGMGLLDVNKEERSTVSMFL